MQIICTNMLKICIKYAKKVWRKYAITKISTCEICKKYAKNMYEYAKKIIQKTSRNYAEYT